MIDELVNHWERTKEFLLGISKFTSMTELGIWVTYRNQLQILIDDAHNKNKSNKVLITLPNGKKLYGYKNEETHNKICEIEYIIQAVEYDCLLNPKFFFGCLVASLFQGLTPKKGYWWTKEITHKIPLEFEEMYMADDLENKLTEDKKILWEEYLRKFPSVKQKQEEIKGEL